jgi:hypothetical protein
VQVTAIAIAICKAGNGYTIETDTQQSNRILHLCNNVRCLSDPVRFIWVQVIKIEVFSCLTAADVKLATEVSAAINQRNMEESISSIRQCVCIVLVIRNNNMSSIHE